MVKLLVQLVSRKACYTVLILLSRYVTRFAFDCQYEDNWCLVLNLCDALVICQFMLRQLRLVGWNNYGIYCSYEAIQIKGCRQQLKSLSTHKLSCMHACTVKIGLSVWHVVYHSICMWVNQLHTWIQINSSWRNKLL